MLHHRNGSGAFLGSDPGSEGLLFDSTFFTRKAQALLRFADVINDPAIEDRMRENAAHCHSQAEFLSDDDEDANDPLAVSQVEQLQLDNHLELEVSRMFQISFSELDRDGNVVAHIGRSARLGTGETMPEKASPSTAFICIVAGLFTIAASNAANTTECFPGPDFKPAPGIRWQYRIDSATNQGCWYIQALSQSSRRGDSGEVTRSSRSVPVSSSTSESAATSGASRSNSGEETPASSSPVVDRGMVLLDIWEPD